MNVVIPASVNKWNAWSTSRKKQYISALLSFWMASVSFQNLTVAMRQTGGLTEPRHSLQICRESVSLSGKWGNAPIQEANLERIAAYYEYFYTSHPVETQKN